MEEVLAGFEEHDSLRARLVLPGHELLEADTTVGFAGRLSGPPMTWNDVAREEVFLAG
jgi:hypothetical protein